jgi:hypothetical protein
MPLQAGTVGDRSLRGPRYHIPRRVP